MRLRRRQQGLGMLGWIVVLAIASFALTCFFKVGPLYLEYWQAKKAIDLVIENSRGSAMSKDQLLTAIEKQLEVSTVEVVKKKDIKITETKGEREVNASYEKRVELLGNIDVVVKFNKLIYKLPIAE